jgi:hypothetical protein
VFLGPLRNLRHAHHHALHRRFAFSRIGEVYILAVAEIAHEAHGNEKLYHLTARLMVLAPSKGLLAQLTELNFARSGAANNARKTEWSVCPN